MCGFAGVITRQPEGKGFEGELRSLAESLRHRGPDDSGTWHDPEGLVHLAHARLAVLDLSDAGRQPMLSKSERFAIVFNGEIYNFPSLRRELVANGCVFRSHSDTEVLLCAIEQFGVREAVRRLVGMFAFFVYDRREQKGWLARDRFGEKPLFLYRRGGRIAFASEIKALKQFGFFRFALDEAAVSEYLAFGYCWTEETLYDGVTRIMPGQLVCIDANSGNVASEHYWDPQESLTRQKQLSPFPGSFEEAVEELDVLLNKAVEGQLLSDAPLGAFLSGGVDSSLISAIAQAQSGRAISTFSIGFSDPRYDESSYARAVARHIGSDHHEWRVSTNDVLEMLPEIFRAYDEPFFDSSAIPTLLLSRFARKQVTVALSGDAGDELFLGYARYARVARLWKSLRFLPGPAREASGLLGAALGGGGAVPLINQAANFVTLAGSKSESELNLLLQVIDKHEYRKWSSVSGYNPRVLSGGLSVARMLDVERYLAGDILVKVDRASMNYSLETRVPLLDRDVVNFSMTLPEEYLLFKGQGKRILRALLERYMPKGTGNPGKKGFSVPLASWLRGSLASWADDVLLQGDAAKVDRLDVPFCRNLLSRVRAGDDRYCNALWSRLQLIQWYVSNAR